MLVVMGVSGSGKSTVGAVIAERLGLDFIDGDSLHSARSVAKMKAGTPLDDADRRPWLDRIGAALRDRGRWPRGLVIACSALKRAYRDRIRAAAPGLRFVFLEGSPALIRDRLTSRSGHYMPSTLLDSQLRTLEVPGNDETDVIRIDVAAEPEDIVEVALLRLG